MVDAPRSQTATVVLIHGAGHGAWCWERVARGLEAVGIGAVAVDLPGHGADDGDLTDLRGDATRVEEILDTVAGPVVLVGHSYGGAVITEAGAHPSVVHLVYIAAMALDENESSGGAAAAGAQFPDPQKSGLPTLRSGFQVAADQRSVTIRHDVARSVFYSDCTDEDAAWAVAQLGPQDLSALAQSPAVVAWRHKPSTYVVCSNDRTVHPDLQRSFASRCTASVEWPTGHSPFLSQPDLVIDLLVGLLGSLPASTAP